MAADLTLLNHIDPPQLPTSFQRTLESHFAHFVVNMPCTFSGIFFVKQFHSNKLLCHASDELGNLQDVEIFYYYPSKIERPFPEAYESVEPNHVYFITGTFAIAGSTTLVLTSFYIFF